VLGGALGSGLFRPALADTRASFAPVPIPGGSPYDGLNGMFHFFGPNSIDPIDAEPSTITNLNGFVGLAYISGMVTQTSTKTGEKLRLPFLTSDMRFMTGEFRGADGRTHYYDVSKITYLLESRSAVDFAVPSVDNWLAIDVADEGQ